MSIQNWTRRRCSAIVIPGELVVERDGRPVALLSDPQLEDMFWFRWQITPLVEDADVTSADFWNDAELTKTVFRCSKSRAIADTAFWAMSNPLRGGRLVLRGAYVPFEVSFRRQPFTWLKLFLLGDGAYSRPAVDDDDDVEPSGRSTGA